MRSWSLIWFVVSLKIWVLPSECFQGGDTIWRLKQNPVTKTYFIQGSLPQPQGSGPRHIAIYSAHFLIPPPRISI